MNPLLIAICLAALALCAQGQQPGFVTSFGIDDVIVMNRTATAFQGESGPAHGSGHVEYFVCRGPALDALSPDLRAALDGRRAVCIGQYRSCGTPHRVLYTVDAPPVRLGVFRQESAGRWTACPDPVPLPDPPAPKDETSLPDPDDPRYARAAEIGGESHAPPPGNALLKIGADALWRAILH